MDVLYIILGIALLVAALVDAIWTTFWVDGSAGPVSSRLTTAIWHISLALLGRRRHYLLSLNGPITLVATLFMWVILLWAGWVFVFSSGDAALLDTRDRTPATWTGRIYFVAYAMFTMGNGDFTPGADIWQITTSLTTGSGMILVTLAVSYVVSVLSAVVQKRSFASQVAALGKRSEDFVIRSWNGHCFPGLELVLSTYTTQLSTLTEQHLAYPILFYYHAKENTKETSIAVTILDESLRILAHGIAPQYRPDPAVLNTARETIMSYLRSLESAFIGPADETPPPPNLDRLRKSGIETVSDEEFAKALSEEDDRRRRILGMVKHSGWHWSDAEE